jgi:ubiquitin C-terminal hydrolase
MRNGQAGLDASIVLGRLGALISRKSGQKFITNTPQDAPEVIAYILDEILICPTISSQLFQIRNRTTSTCDACLTSSVSEDLCSILTVPVSNSVSSSLSNFFSERVLDGENQWFCPLCNSPQDATYSTKNHGAPQVLIIQLSRFTHIGIGQVLKMSTPVRPDTNVSITETVSDTETIIHIYKLVAVICHSGNYVGGHYTATVLDRVSNKWYLCNDRTISETTINICEDGYTFFYVRDRLAIS